MSVMDVIKGRRTVHEFKADPVTREQIEQMLEAAIWAPNHKLTNPWEFYVVSGIKKEELARLRAELKRSKQADSAPEQAQRVYEKAYLELMTVPYAILVCQRVMGDGKQQAEDLIAVGCAIQNLMLAAEEMGIGTFWGTGPVINHPETFRICGVPHGRHGVGLLQIGYPAREQKAPGRDPLEKVVHWVE